MDKNDYENPELFLEAIEECGIDVSAAKELYAQKLEKDIEDVNAKIDVINDILLKLDEPNKVASLIWGLMGMVTDPDIFAAKILMLLDDEALKTLHDDICGEPQNSENDAEEHF